MTFHEVYPLTKQYAVEVDVVMHFTLHDFEAVPRGAKDEVTAYVRESFLPSIRSAVRSSMVRGDEFVDDEYTIGTITEES